MGRNTGRNEDKTRNRAIPARGYDALTHGASLPTPREKEIPNDPGGTGEKDGDI